MSGSETSERPDEQIPESAASQADKLGLPPGTLVHVGERHCAEVALAGLVYGPEAVEEVALGGPDDVARHLGADRLLWLDVVGLHDVEAVGALGREPPPALRGEAEARSARWVAGSSRATPARDAVGWVTSVRSQPMRRNAFSLIAKWTSSPFAGHGSRWRTATECQLG